METRLLLFRLTADDFEFQYFCTGGNGGQHRNAKKNGVRCIHRPSGSVAEHRDGRDQHSNKKSAWLKCIETDKFKLWHKAEVARRLNHGDIRSIEERVEAAMQPENILVEYVGKV